jgi:hypothetical protein
MSAKLAATAHSPSPSAPSAAEGTPHNSEPGDSSLPAPAQYGAPLSGPSQASSASNAMGRSVVASGEGSSTALKSSNCCTRLLASLSSGLSLFSPFRGFLGRTLSYLTAQAVILAVVNGTIISFSSPLTAVPVICALVDEVMFNSDQEDRKRCRSLVLEAVFTAAIVAGTYSVYLPFKEHTIKIMSVAPDSIAPSSNSEMNTNTAIHIAAGAAAYAGYRITHAVQRFLYGT